MWNIRTGALLAVHNLPRDRSIPYNKVDTCHDQFIIFLEGEDHTVEAWNFQTRTQLCCFQGCPRPHSRYIIDRNQTVILSGRYYPHKDINIWDASTGQLRHSLQMTHPTPSQWFTVSSDGQWAFCGNTGMQSHPCLIKAWDLQTGQERYTLTPTSKRTTYIDWGRMAGNDISQGVCAMLTSRDGRLLITALYEGIIQIWDLQTGTFLRQFPVPKGTYDSDQYLQKGIVMALAPDDQTLLCQRSGYQSYDCFMLNVETGETLSQHYSQSTEKIVFLVFSEDSQKIILYQPTHSYPSSRESPSASSHTSLSVWNWRSQKPPSPLMLEAIYS